jgi:aminopeptidase N
MFVCKNGAQGLAYSTIVMSGENLPYGHYHRYNRTLLEGDFVVLDAGPTYQYYDADVSTSFPANGKFTPKQAELYAIANGIREVCIKSYKPGITFSQVGQNVRKYLVDQGLNPDEPRFKGYIKYGGYNHSIGMAVHDGMGTFAGPDEVLEKGFVFACDINMIYADINIGIRLEDTIVITADGCEVLSAGVPRTIKEVENAMFGYQKNAIYQRPVQVERSRDFDALHYDISLNVDMDQKRLSGVNKVTLKPLNNGFSSCALDAEFLIVSGVNDQNGKPLTFKQENNQVLINFDRTYSHSDTIVFDVHYSLNQAVLGLRFIDETPTNPKLVSSDCFPNKAHQWIPCSDYPSDKVTTDIRVTTDKKYKVLANGKLIGVSSSNQPTPNSHTWHWRQSLPHSTYLISLSIGDYAVIEDSLGSLPVNYWVYNWHVEDAKRSFAKTPHMISFYNKLYGYDYPWEKYDQVITSYMGGGAEATTATILGQGAVTDKNAEQDFSYERVIAHEIAHHWWGDLITLRSWEHTWMNESFATYSDYLYTRAEYGEDAGAYDLLGKKNQYLNEARNRYIRPIVFNRYDNPGDNFDSHTYPKGANVLHLLRYILGDDAFFRTLSAFLHKYEFEPVDTHDFMKTVKEVTGKNMDWFFEQYVFSPGHAIFEVTKNWDESRKVLKVKVVQKQDSSPGMPIYTMPVNLGFHYPYEHIVKEVWLKQKEETFEFPLNSEPLLVRFDEGNYLLKEIVFKKPVEELLYQVENDDVIGRLAAVDELKEFGSNPTVIKAWADRVAKDSFWAVRQAALNNLGTFAATENLDLIKQASRDENSKVRLSAVRILGNRMDKTMIRFFKQIFENDNSYLVKAEALKSIGKVGSKKDIPFLNQAASEKSHNNLVGKAAAEAQAMIK